MREIPQWEFDFYALSLPRGHGFGDTPPVAAWSSDDGNGCGIVTENGEDNSFGLILMRRRVDSVWTVTKRAGALRQLRPHAEHSSPTLRLAYA